MLEMKPLRAAFMKPVSRWRVHIPERLARKSVRIWFSTRTAFTANGLEMKKKAAGCLRRFGCRCTFFCLHEDGGL